MLYDLRDNQWEIIKDILPGKDGDRGRTGLDNHKGRVWLARTGAPWRALPLEYGKWPTVHKRFMRWAGMQEQGLGRSKGGFSSTLHAACDALGNPVRFFVTAGQGSDDVKALDEAEAVICPRPRRKIARTYDQELYKERNVIIQ